MRLPSLLLTLASLTAADCATARAESSTTSVSTAPSGLTATGTNPQVQGEARAQAPVAELVEAGARGSTSHAQAIASMIRDAQSCAERGDYAQAETVLREAIARGERHAGLDHPIAVEAIDQLAYVMMVTQRYAESESLRKRALAMRKAAHLDITPSATALASLMMMQGRLDDADSYLQEARAFLRLAYPLDQAAFARNDMRMAMLLRARGKYTDAEVLLKQALGVLERSPAGNEDPVFEILDALGGVYLQTQRIDEAVAIMQRALALAEKKYGESHHRVATALNDLGVMELERGHAEQARGLITRALRMREKLLGPMHLDCATSLAALASVEIERDEYVPAEQHMARALAVNEVGLGPNSSEVADNLRVLGLVYLLQEQPAKAAPVLARAWELGRDAALGHDQRRAQAGRLAKVYRELKREDDALAMERWLADNP